jgi:hypothetical protein
VKKFNQARVNGGSNYDSLNDFTIGDKWVEPGGVGERLRSPPPEPVVSRTSGGTSTQVNGVLASLIKLLESPAKH